jgi:hypothetical protein
MKFWTITAVSAVLMLRAALAGADVPEVLRVSACSWSISS